MTVHDPIHCAILGSGNIGTDLLYKLLRSPVLRPVWMVGIDPTSDGLKRAREVGLATTDRGLDGLLPHVEEDAVRIAFDATSAGAHHEHAPRLRSAGVFAIDLTPAAIGPYCVPPVNLDRHTGEGETNVNLVTCGGQATIPIVHAVSRVQPVAYAEIIATVSSRSAGPGTRKNIDEFTRTTARGLETVGGAERGKAIIILNPAEPPLIMRNTVHCLTEQAPQEEAVADSIRRMIAEVQRYVPGYRLKNELVFEQRRVSVFIEVEGNGDYLPRYAGNLDIMTAAATRVGELVAEGLVAASGRAPAGVESAS
jgi:acetaldehyde/propanal dehydrogenase